MTLMCLLPTLIYINVCLIKLIILFMQSLLISKGIGKAHCRLRYFGTVILLMIFFTVGSPNPFLFILIKFLILHTGWCHILGCHCPAALWSLNTHKNLDQNKIDQYLNTLSY